MRKQDDYQNICANIRYLRQRYGLSRTAMAHRLGVTIKTLDLLEAGIWPDRIRIQLLFNICTAFKIPIKALLSTRLESGDK